MESNELTIREDVFWFKVVDFLQTNWALIESTVEGVRVAFVQDASGIFYRLDLPDEREAERQLRLNGFRRFAEDEEARKFLRPPAHP